MLQAASGSGASVWSGGRAAVPAPPTLLLRHAALPIARSSLVPQAGQEALTQEEQRQRHPSLKSLPVPSFQQVGGGGAARPLLGASPGVPVYAASWVDSDSFCQGRKQWASRRQ